MVYNGNAVFVVWCNVREPLFVTLACTTHHEIRSESWPLVATKSSQLIQAMMRARASGCTVAYLAQGPCRAPNTGGARRTEPLKAATRSSTFAHAHKGRGMRCSSTQKSAGPAGRRALREARAAPDRALAELLDSLRALDCTSFVSRC